MALDVDVPELGNEVLGKVQITDNYVFIHPKDEEITTGDLVKAISHHEGNFQKEYRKYKKYYKGEHDIKNKTGKAKYKPDNRLIVNFPKKLVIDFNGFFNGTPVKIDHADDSLDDYIKTWSNFNNFEDVMTEASKASSIYGRAYFCVYQDESGQPCITNCDPMNSFVIYDDTFAQNAKYGVMYRKNSDGKLLVTVMTDRVTREFIEDDVSGEDMVQLSSVANPYPIVPLIEVMENEERIPLCGDLYSIFDEIDKAMSEKANDVDYFADAYLKIIGFDMDEETIETIRDDRVINARGDEGISADVNFLSKPDADNTQENLINRLVDFVYQIANVTNINDDSFSGNPSGVSLKLKYQPMKNMADTKSLKFKRALRDVFKCVLSVSGSNKDAWQEITFKFTQSVPQNTLELSQVATNLHGIISDKTLFGLFPFVEDPEKEIEQVREEQEETQKRLTELTKVNLKTTKDIDERPSNDKDEPKDKDE